ncbi:MAG TPA: ABC transporter permease subunit [Acidimicrobiales bacterium]|nr:ABC transporter permease subunit [Acidimicrobiales bacterium]
MIWVEFKKQWRRPRTVITFAALAVFSVVLTVAISATGSGTVERVGDVPLLIVPGTSGLSVPVIALSSTMKFFLPLAVAIFAGESVAGEAGWGSLRYALARPVSRAAYLATKLFVALVLSLVAIVLIPVAAVVAGTVAFGWHHLVIVNGAASTATHQVVANFSPGLVLGYLGVATAYVAAGMMSIFAFSFLLSTLTTRPFVAVAGGVSLTIVSRVFNSDYLPGVAVLNPYMPNNDVDLWQNFFVRPAVTSGMAHFLVLQVVYVVVFLGAAWIWFVRKDILT